MTELRAKITAIGITITGLSGRFYHVEAPQGCPKPYSVYSFYAGSASRDSATKFEQQFMQINHYGENLTELEAIEKSSKNKFEDSEADFAGMTDYHLDRIERLGTPRRAKLGQIWQITEQYKLDLTKL